MGRHTVKVRTAVIAVVATCLASAQPALGQGGGCLTGDGGRLTPRPAEPWNLGGGVDSDGCRYAVDETGSLRVPTDPGLVTCSTCEAGFPKDVAGLALSADERARLSAVLSQVGASVARPWETAAVAVGVLGPTRLGPGRDAVTRRGELLLRGAWAARGQAVAGKVVGGYAPATLEEARAQIATLRRRVLQDPRRRPDVIKLESLLTGLEAARASLDEGLFSGLDAVREALSTLDADSREPALQSLLQSRRSLLQSQSRLARIERQLLAQKLALLDQAGASREDLSERQLRRALARALIRFGDAAGWRAQLDALGPDGERIRASCRLEARLLEAAEARFLEAALATPAQTEKARLLFLAGDAARRRGQARDANARFADVVRLAPESEAGLRAASLRQP